MPDRWGNNTMQDWMGIAHSFNAMNEMDERNTDREEQRTRNAEKDIERRGTQEWADKFASREIDPMTFDHTKVEGNQLHALKGHAVYMRNWKESEEGRVAIKKARFEGAESSYKDLQIARKKMKHFQKKGQNDVALKTAVDWMNNSANSYCAEVNENGKADVYLTEDGTQMPLGEMGLDDLIAESEKYNEEKYFQFYSANAELTNRNNIDNALNYKVVTNGKDVLKWVQRYDNETRTNSEEFYDANGRLVDMDRERLIKQGYYFKSRKEIVAEKKAKHEASVKNRENLMKSAEFIGKQLFKSQNKSDGDPLLAGVEGNEQAEAQTKFKQALDIANGDGDEMEKALAVSYIQTMAQLYPELKNVSSGAISPPPGGKGGNPFQLGDEDKAAIMGNSSPQPQEAIPSPEFSSQDVRDINPGIDAAVDKYQDEPSWSHRPAIEPSGGNAALDASINQYYNQTPQNLLEDQEVLNQMAIQPPKKQAIPDDQYNFPNLVTVR